MKQKELEMLLHCLEEVCALKGQNEKEAFDARDSCFDDAARPSKKSRSPFNWNSPRSKDVFGGLDQTDKLEISTGHQNA